MSIVNKTRTLDFRISRALSRAAAQAVGPSALEPLEIVHAIVDEVERQVQPGGRGVRVFPFNRVAVSLLASSRAARVRLEAAFTANPTMRERLLDRLRSVGCDVPDLRVDLAYVGRVAPNWEHPQFHLAFDRVASAPSPAPAAPAPARIEITIVRGAAERRTYTLAAQRIDLGRGAEVRDSRNRLLRTNHVVFTEGSPGENETVSRRHAHMACDTSSGAYRLFDDGSVHGTGIVRDGRTIAVPAGSRGVRVRSGDEIVLGEARIRIRMS